MKKLTFTVISVAAPLLLMLLLLVAPVFIGRQVQQSLQRELALVAEQTNGDISAHLENYDPGWFHSTGRISWSFSDAYLAAIGVPDQHGFSLPIHTRHGPILLSRSATGPSPASVGLAAFAIQIDAHSHPQLQSFMEQTGNSYLVQASIELGIDGAVDVQLQAPAFTINNLMGTDTLGVFAGARGTGTFTPAERRFKFNGELQGLSLHNEDVEAVLAATAMYVELVFPRVEQQQLEPAAFLLQANVESQHIAYLDSQFNSLDIRQALLALSVQADVLHSQTIDLPLHQWLASGVQVQVHTLDFLHQDEQFSAQAELRSNPAALPPATSFNADDLLYYPGLLQAQAQVSLTRPLMLALLMPQITRELRASIPADSTVDEQLIQQVAAAQAPLVLGTLIGQGILQENNADLQIQVHYADNTLLINGRPLPPLFQF